MFVDDADAGVVDDKTESEINKVTLKPHMTRGEGMTDTESLIETTGNGQGRRCGEKGTGPDCVLRWRISIQEAFKSSLINANNSQIDRKLRESREDEDEEKRKRKKKN
uniref:Uncharacterized protein n=1 Tax=Glossina palpalis gambiensis TaxID=67801 RepID=A0A1B0BRK5_9MUSC